MPHHLLLKVASINYPGGEFYGHSLEMAICSTVDIHIRL